MATEIKTWQIVKGKLTSIDTKPIKEDVKETYDIEEWISSNPSIIGHDIAIIGRQVHTQSGPLDLLGIDKDGNIIIIELKRDKLPREALAQAVDYASDIANWSIEKIGEICATYNDKNLEEFLVETFQEISIENININDSQRIILVGFSIEESLERMVSWLSNFYGVSINAVILNYIKTISGDELLTKTSIISEEVEQAKTKKKKFIIEMSNEPGHHDDSKLENLLKQYLSLKMWSTYRLRKIILPYLLIKGKANSGVPPIFWTNN